MAVADWHQSAATGFTDIDALARFLGALKPRENVPRWLKRMAARLAVRLREMVKPQGAPVAVPTA